MIVHTPAKVTELCRCGAIAYRLIGTVAHCDACADELLEPIRGRVILDESGIGTGRQVGVLRTDFGDRWADLACTLCPYQWVGPIAETCPACTDRAVRLQELQRARILRPVLPEPADPRYSAAMDAWHARIAGAVVAGLITADEADAATGQPEAVA